MGKKPSHYAYNVKDVNGQEKGIWTRIGAVWPHDDGKGFNVKLDCLPVDGNLVVREAAEAENAEANGERAAA